MQPLEKELPIEEEHPSVGELVGFLRGELTPEGAKTVVRHLLTNCLRCQRVTSRYWELGEMPLSLEILVQEAAAMSAEASRHEIRGGEPARRPRVSATTKIAAAREQLREIVLTLREVDSRLRKVRSSLPVPSLDLDRLEEDVEEDIEAEIRAVISCVLDDWIGPAVRDLRGSLPGGERRGRRRRAVGGRTRGGDRVAAPSHGRFAPRRNRIDPGR